MTVDIIIQPEELEQFNDHEMTTTVRDPLPMAWTQVTDEYGLLHTFDENGKQVCGAWRRKARKYCTKAPSVGRNRCELHGGKSLRGIASPSYKGKGLTKDMPARLAERFREAQQDDELLSLRNDVALVQAMIGEQLSLISQGDSGDIFIQAKQTYRELLSALRSENNVESTRLLALLGEIIENGYKDEIAKEEIRKSLELKRKLSDSEKKRLVDLKQMITTEELMLVVGALVDSVKRNVNDSKALQSISQDLRRLLADRGFAPK